MDEKRKGEIALAYLKYLIPRKGILPTHSIKRDVGNVAKETGIPYDELREFVITLIDEAYKEALGILAEYGVSKGK